MSQYRAIIFAATIGLTGPVAAGAQTSAPVVAAQPVPPAAQPASTAIPEPGDFGLFLIGVAGLVVGRWSSRARKRRTKTSGDGLT